LGIFGLSQWLSRGRRWYDIGSCSDLHENPGDAEMDDLEEHSTTPRQDIFGDTEVNEDIDNPI
jgi:hypothetical protein